MKLRMTAALALTAIWACYGCVLDPQPEDRAEERVAPARSAVLSGCVWGDGAFVKTGRAGSFFPFTNTRPFAVLSPVGNHIGMFLSNSNGSGTFTFTNALLGDSSWGQSGYTWSGDFNADGIGDIASGSGNTIYLKIGSGGGFTTQARTVANAWGASGYTFAADLTGDGRTDIASISGGNVYVHLAYIAPDGKPAFDDQTWFVTNQWGQSGFTFAADFTGDGKADIASGTGGTIYLKKTKPSVDGMLSNPYAVANLWGASA